MTPLGGRRAGWDLDDEVFVVVNDRISDGHADAAFSADDVGGIDDGVSVDDAGGGDEHALHPLEQHRDRKRLGDVITAPACIASTICSPLPTAVNMITGMMAPRSRSARNTSRPDRPGINMSSRMTSGRAWSAVSRAPSPSLANNTSHDVRRSKTRRTISRFTLSSSTTRTRAERGSAGVFTRAPPSSS